MIRILLVVVLIFSAKALKAQDTLSTHRFKSSFKVIVLPHYTQRLQLKHFGVPILESVPAGSVAAGFGLYTAITRNMGLNTGFLTSIAPYRYRFGYALPPGSNPNIYDYLDDKESTYFIVYHAFPVTLQRYFPYRKSYYLSVKAGVAPTYIYPFETGESLSTVGKDDSTELRLFEMKQRYAGRSWYTNYMAAVGAVKQTKRGNTFELFLIAHYAPREISRGTYQYSNIPVTSFGNVKLRMNYLGLEFNYGITFLKNRKKPLNLKQL